MMRPKVIDLFAGVGGLSLGFENSGFEKADKLENADVILVNTCAIRGTAENKILGFLGRYFSNFSY